MSEYRQVSPGQLFIVATPIGNLKDISFRAVETLQSVDQILVEDTRNAVKLLQHYNIKTPMRAVHEHNETQISTSIISRILEGENMALISDAGTPLVSDPGYRLVCSAQAAKLRVVPIPGACAAIAALSVAGLPSNRFVFEGFLPAKTSAREQRLLSLEAEARTLIFYEAKHRILAFLNSLKTVFGEQRKISVGRELTKKFESLYQGTINEVIEQLSADPLAQKGEFVLIVSGAEKIQNDAELDQLLAILLLELSVKKASKMAATILGRNKNQCYERALVIQKTPQKEPAK